MFARKLNKSFSQIPLSYTIGYRNKQNEIRTIFEIFDFKKRKLSSDNDFVNIILEDFSKSLIYNINKLIQRKDAVKMNEINFIGWNPSLEKQLLDSIFKRNVPINSLIWTCFDESVISIKREVSLSKITKKGYKEKKYFVKFREEINKTLSAEDIKKYNLNHDGAIASYAGFVLYNIVTKTKKTKYHIYMDSDLLVEELKEYALDDINRMYYFLDNLSEAKNMMRKLKIADGLKKEMNKNAKLLDLLSSYNPNIKVKDLIKKLEKENEECCKKIPLFDD